MRTFFVMTCLVAMKFGYAQQRIILADSVFVNVIKQFITEAKLKGEHVGLVKVNLVSFHKELVMEHRDTFKIGEVKSVLTEPRYDVNYSFYISNEIDRETINWDPVTYFTEYKEIPILLMSGFEHVIAHVDGRKRELRAAIKNHSEVGVLLNRVIWFVEITNDKVNIRKRSSDR